MKKILLFLFLGFFICKIGNTQQVYAPVAVSKTNSKRVFVHVMPWFETKTSNGGSWGYHWKMNTKNPDIILSNGQRDIASWFYPKIGPYASGDPDVVEYQLLLMKLSGIDGIAIDWYGTQNKYDYPKNKANSEKLIALLQKVGLNYTIVYEDATLNNASDKSVAAKADMSYMQTNYFSQSNYEKYNNNPLLLTFGPQGLTSQAAWTDAFSVLSPKPSFFPLWYNYNAGSNTTGYFAWIYSDYLTGLNSFYNNGSFPTKIGSVYPGFKTYYTAGGASGPTWEIAHNGTTAFNATLDLALSKNLPIIQLNTWNDYGEGSMIEPTNEFGYSFLTSLQQKLGVSNLTQHDLELVDTLYDQRKQFAGNATEQARLDQAFYYIVSLQMAQAESVLLGTSYTPPPPLPDPWDSLNIGTTAGSASYNLDTFKVKGSGADIYGTADGFEYVYQPITGDVTIKAKVISIDNTNIWAKAGLMIRDGLSAGAANATIVITPSNGINFQYRSAASGVTANIGGNFLTVPYWLKLERSGTTISGSYSVDGINWTLLGSMSAASMSSTVYVGMAVTSHTDGVIANGNFTNVIVESAPVINSFSPAYGVTGSTITIKGKRFTSASTISFGGTAAASYAVVSDSVITAIVANGKSGNVSVTTNYGAVSKSGFTYQLCPTSGTTLTSNLTGSSYQWQQNTGAGFFNIIDDGNYTGTNSAVLQLNNLPSSWNAYEYRCLVNGNYSNTLSLKFVNTWTGAGGTSAWENPANWSCGTLPDINSDVIINNGNVILNSNVSVRSLTLTNSSYLTVNTNKTITINH